MTISWSAATSSYRYVCIFVISRSYAPTEKNTSRLKQTFLLFFYHCAYIYLWFLSSEIFKNENVTFSSKSLSLMHGIIRFIFRCWSIPFIRPANKKKEWYNWYFRHFFVLKNLFSIICVSIMKLHLLYLITDYQFLSLKVILDFAFSAIELAKSVDYY